MHVRHIALAASISFGLIPAAAGAQTTPAAEQPAAAPAAAPAAELPEDYIVGPEDVLGIVFWGDPKLSSDVIVRPDGKISLPLVNDIEVIGLTPEQVRLKVIEHAKRFVEAPAPTVVVRQINSRKVFITGMVARPGPFPLLRSTTVLQLIALAGGLLEFANAGDIVVVRNDHGQQLTFPFNYNDLKNRRNLTQNISLRPGDTVIVP